MWFRNSKGHTSGKLGETCPQTEPHMPFCWCWWQLLRIILSLNSAGLDVFLLFLLKDLKTGKLETYQWLTSDLPVKLLVDTAVTAMSTKIFSDIYRFYPSFNWLVRGWYRNLCPAFGSKSEPGGYRILIQNLSSQSRHMRRENPLSSSQQPIRGHLEWNEEDPDSCPPQSQ